MKTRRTLLVYGARIEIGEVRSCGGDSLELSRRKNFPWISDGQWWCRMPHEVVSFLSLEMYKLGGQPAIWILPGTFEATYTIKFLWSRFQEWCFLLDHQCHLSPCFHLPWTMVREIGSCVSRTLSSWEHPVSDVSPYCNSKVPTNETSKF